MIWFIEQRNLVFFWSIVDHKQFFILFKMGNRRWAVQLMVGIETSIRWVISIFGHKRSILNLKF